MRYLQFSIKNYRAISDEITIDIAKNSLLPLVGINECGKTTILQAIYCFDSINDEEYDGKHMKDTKNLYHTIEAGDPIISAKIDIKFHLFRDHYSAIIKDYNGKIQDDIKKKAEGDETIIIKDTLSDELSITKNSFQHLVIERNLTTKQHRITNIDVPEEINSKLARRIVLYLPYILYNDDFMDRPPNFLEIPETKPSTLSGWLAIFEKLFNLTSEDYSLFSLIKESDSRRRDAILSDVEAVLNATLIKSWRQFALSHQGTISIRLQLNKRVDTKNKIQSILEVKVVEKVDSKERYFDVIDRSKGFLWFFNFVMKLEFNPKVLDDSDSSTIHLLDEPGSYLHY